MNKLVEERSLTVLDAQERGSLGVFCAAQFLRGQAQRDTVSRMNALIEQKILAMGGDPRMVQNWSPMSEDEVKVFSIQFLITNLREFGGQFVDKVWLLMEAPKDEYFYISDNPITLHNGNDFGPYGNLGLGVKGIQIHFPISPNLTLAMYHPSILQEAEEGNRQARKARAQLSIRQLAKLDPTNADALAAAERAIQNTGELLIAARQGRPVLLSAENVTFYNSLQVAYASRLIMSAKRNFSLAREMIQQNGEMDPSLILQA